MLRSIRMAVGALGLLLLAPAVASADSYLVFSCTDPLGQPNAAAGWSASSTPGGLTTNTCGAANGRLSASLVEPTPAGNSTASWRFTAPFATRIIRVGAQRATKGLGPSGEPEDISYLMRTDDQLLESCAPGPNSSCVADVSAPLDKAGLNGSYVEFRVLCRNAGFICTRPVGVDAAQIAVALQDQQAPVVANQRVIDDGDSSGKLRISYNAIDFGGGLYRALVKVDGKIRQTVSLAPAPCADVNPSDGDPYQFNVPVPCLPGITDANVTVDVRTLPPGPHGVEVAVEDAAGNATPIYGPIEFPRLNAPTGSSTNVRNLRHAKLRMWFVKAPKRGKRYTSRYGTRVVTRGVLRDRRGRPIQSARIDVYHIRRDGKRKLVKTGLKSRRRGRLTLILPNNVDTRTIEFAYRALRPGRITSSVRLRLTVRRSGKVYYRTGKG